MKGPHSNGFKSADDSSDMNTSMDESSYCSESVMLHSPPRAPRASRSSTGSRSLLSFGAGPARLFLGDDQDEENHSPLRSQSSILKPLDLNLELNGATSAKSGNGFHEPPEARTPQRKTGIAQRKRTAEQQFIGRDLSFDDVDESNSHQSSPVDRMMHSPQSSPTFFRSPYSFHTASAHAAHKSPCFRTLDGRTVQSKNPFSPMYVVVPETGAEAPAAPLSDSLNFPVSLEDKTGSSNNAPLLRHRLQKRSTNVDSSMFRSVTASTAPPANQVSMPSKDGYPAQHGLYSFTGSPIKEMEYNHPSHTTESAEHVMHGFSHKVRRRTKLDDAAVAASNAEAPPRYKQLAPALEVDTTQPLHNTAKSFYYRIEDTSPTDVLSFPSMHSPSSPKTTVPPTPSKQRPSHHRPAMRYTPVKKITVPATPMAERRSRNSFDHADADCSDLDMSVGAPGPAPSRFYSDFDIIGELGNGSFGNVFKVMSRLDGCMYAIKVAHRPAKGHADKDRMLKEVYALAALSDQADTATFHIVRYHQAWMEENRLYIQTELCTTTLSARVMQLSPTLLSEEQRYKFLREICLALEFIHKNDMVHLDIKPENIFIKNDQYKLGDFGLVSKVSAHDVEEGDSRYMSMELLSGDHTDLTKSDIFSLGITLYEICLGGMRSLPTNGPEWQALRAATFSPLASTPNEMQHMMKLMMNPNAAARPSASELLTRPQLLSPEQKALLAERNKVVEANLALAAQADRLKNFSIPPMPARGMMVRRSTWNGV